MQFLHLRPETNKQIDVPCPIVDIRALSAVGACTHSSVGYRVSVKGGREEMGRWLWWGEGVRPRSGSELWGRRDEEGPHPPRFIDRVTPLASALTNSPPYYLRFPLFSSLLSLLIFSLAWRTHFPRGKARRIITFAKRNWVTRIDRVSRGQWREFGENISGGMETFEWKLRQGEHDQRSRLICWGFFKVVLLTACVVSSFSTLRSTR